jgi:serpin B
MRATSISAAHIQDTLKSGNTGGLSVYELGYRGGAMAMDFLVPSGAVADLEASLTSASLGAALASLGQARANVEVQLPKFAFHTHLALVTILSGLGMPDLFDPAKADLSRLDGAKDLSVSTFVQEATIQVDETGTVAAAATAGGAVATSYSPPITINRPFLFVLRDTSNGSLLFMGHVEDPRQD